MRPFTELGEIVESRWRDDNYNEDLFPAIAAQALRESELATRVDPWDIIRWVHTTSHLPRQPDPKAKFGNPPITLFAGARFYIDVYFWLDGTTSIHQHAFSGAFQVLLGSSVHSHYTFEQHREINPYFLTGRVSLKDVSLLTKGNIREIRSGPQFIHSLFHLERPSATIAVRSDNAPRDAIQYSYLKPYLAVDPLFREDSLLRKIQTVSLLLSMKHPEADQIISDLLDQSDFQTTFAVLETAFDFLGRNDLEELFKRSTSTDRFKSLLDRARLKHGELVDLLLPVFREKQRQTDITTRRGMIDGEDHRFLLALLLNVPERAMVLDLVKQRFPDADPVVLILRWIKELTGIKVFGSAEPNVLGLEGFESGHLGILEGLLRGLSDEQIAYQASAEMSAEHVRAVIDRWRSSLLFESVLGTKSSVADGPRKKR